MNRKQRRRADRRRQTPSIVQQYASAYACPDCLADKELVDLGDGVYHLTVMHDDTCPTYRAMRRSR